MSSTYGGGQYQGGAQPPPYGRGRPSSNPIPIPPGDEFAVGCGCVVAVLATCFLGFVIIPALGLLTTFFFGWHVYGYLARLASVMGLGRAPAPVQPPPPPDKGSGRLEPAYTHYLFGPALTDIRQTVRVALPVPLEVCREWDGKIRRALHYRSPVFITAPAGLAAWLCLMVATIAAFVAIALLWLLQLGVVVALAAVLVAGALALRAVDSGMRRVKGIRTSCPSCHLRVNYPSYECAGQGCGRLHRDVRPGRYGVLKRRCACGTLLPTLLLTGSGDGRMQAICPHPDCREPMSKGAGAVPEIVIPVLGAATAGKTRLMTALVMGLLDGEGGYGAEAEFADDESEAKYRGLADKLRAGVHTWKTPKAVDAPLRAYSLRLRPPTGAARLFHIFDAPGELITRSENLQALRYIRQARTFLFTIDLLSIDTVWDALEPADRTRHRGLRSDVAPRFAFDQIVQSIEGHGVQIGRARLAVALTKDDLVRGCAALSGVGDRSDDLRRWLEDEAGLDGMVRAMRRSFAEVRFFRTSSWLDGGELDDGVLDLTGWILVSEGLRVHHST